MMENIGDEDNGCSTTMEQPKKKMRSFIIPDDDDVEGNKEAIDQPKILKAIDTPENEISSDINLFASDSEHEENVKVTETKKKIIIPNSQSDSDPEIIPKIPFDSSPIPALNKKNIAYSSEDEERVIDTKGKIDDYKGDVIIQTDSTWTLRHQRKSENVSELSKGSEIYINNFELKKALSICSQQNELARALLKIVFTEKALKSCSLYGKKTKGLGKTDIIRPGLHKAGVDAILYSVQGYAKKMNWLHKDRLLIVRSMTSKLNENKGTEQPKK